MAPGTRIFTLRSLIFKTLAGFILVGASYFAHAQQYEAFSVLGTPSALCRPGIETGSELQSFFANNRELVEQVLADANWQGDPVDIFAAVAAGEFTEGNYDKGSKFQWISQKEAGKGVALPYRIWAGEESFAAFELNIESQCQIHQLVIPKACCNLSLVVSSKVATPEPVITIESDNENVTICSDAGTEAIVTNADGSTASYPLDDAGCWAGALKPGSISVNVTNTDDCGSATSTASHLVAAAPVAAAAPVVEEPSPRATALIPFIGLFAGNEIRLRYEPVWEKSYKDNADVWGVKAGILKPLSESVSLFTQIGYLDRDGVNPNYVFSDDTIFWDVGADRNIGATGFAGGGIGYWNLADSAFDDVSLFVHGGSSIAGSNAQWFLEGRVFGEELSNISSNNMVTGGIRYLFK